MTDNLELWNKLGKTAPEHTKKFARAGGFRGTAIKPIYTEQKMTEVFGPAGKGWGMGEPTFQVVTGNDSQVAVYCTVALWWRTNETSTEINKVYGVGGDMVVVKQTNGLRTDDEAFKKAFTDALGNAMKHLGMSADVHMGLFDDSKYVNERNAEERASEGSNSTVEGDPDVPAKPASKMKTRPLDGELRAEMDNCTSSEQLDILWHSAKFKAEVTKLPNDWQALLQEHYATAMTAWANNAAARDEIIASLKAATSLPDLKDRWEAKGAEIGELPESMFKEVDAEKETMKKAVRAAAIAGTP